MTALDTSPAIAWAERDTHFYANLVAGAASVEMVEWAAARALIQAAQHAESAALMVRAVRATVLVRKAELAVLAASKADGYEEWFAALAAAQVAARTAARPAAESTNFRGDLDAIRATVEFDHVADQPADQLGRLLPAFHEQPSLREEHPDERGKVGGVSDQHVISQPGVEHLEAARELDGADLLSVGPFLGRLDELRGATHNSSPSLDGSGSPSVGAGLVGEVPPASPTGHNTTGQVAE